MTAVMALAVACGGDGKGQDDPASEVGAFTAFVIDLVENRTANDTKPAPLDDFAALPDPDLDKNNKRAYSSLFEQR